MTPPCGVPALLRVCLAFLHHPGGQPAPDQLEHSRVADALLHQPQENVVADGIEVALDIGIDDHGLSAEGDGGADLLQRHVGVAPGAEAVGAIEKVGFEDRFQHQFGRHLHHPVFDHRDPQRAFLGFARLVDPAATHRLGPVALLVQFVRGFLRGTFQRRGPLRCARCFAYRRRGRRD